MFPTVKKYFDMKILLAVIRQLIVGISQINASFIGKSFQMKGIFKGT